MYKTYYYDDNKYNVLDKNNGKSGNYLDIWNCMSWEEREIYDNNFKVFVACQEDNY